MLSKTHQLEANTYIATGAPCCSVTRTVGQGNKSTELALRSKTARLQEWTTDAHLLLNRVVLPDIGLDLLDNWPVLNLGECLGITDGSLSSRGGGCLQSTHKLVSNYIDYIDYKLMQGSADTNSAVLKKVMMMLLWCEMCSKTGV